MIAMKQIVICALKGGVGKTFVTVNLGAAFIRLGTAVGLLDADVTAPKLHKALGLVDPPPWQVDAAKECVLPNRLDNFQFVTLASLYGADNPAVLWKEDELVEAARELVSGVVQWGDDIDLVLIDTPPSSSDFMQSLYEHLSGRLYGVILVFQPTDIAIADLFRTLDFIRINKIPLMGLISNMDYCLSPSGERFWPFLSPRVELESVCQEQGVVMLGTIPLSPSADVIDRSFDSIAASVLNCKPKLIQDNLPQKLYKSLKRAMLKVAIRSI